ncbi:MAG: lytic transglycosylase domain-containing protein [Thermodesulfobacteriota bacterium]
MSDNRSPIFVTMVAITLLGLCSVAGSGWASAAGMPAHFGTLRDGFRYGFPPDVEKQGLVFAGQKVLLQREDIRRRILSELNYLLLDRRSRVILWLERADTLRPIIGPILRQYKVPGEIIYLAAIESSYNPRALSSAKAYGLWQFMPGTARDGRNAGAQYDWTMKVTQWADERADLVKSTQAAAKYLGWLNEVKKVTLSDGKEQAGFGDWFLSVAAYNAGPQRVMQRLAEFGEKSYWDVPLPLETERYVPRWIAIGLIARYRKHYGVEIAKQPALTFDTIDDLQLKKDLSIATVAKLLKTTPREIWMLNSELKPDKAIFPAKSGRTMLKHTIKIPKGTKTDLLSKLAAEGYVKNPH